MEREGLVNDLDYLQGNWSASLHSHILESYEAHTLAFSSGSTGKEVKQARTSAGLAQVWLPMTAQGSAARVSSAVVSACANCTAASIVERSVKKGPAIMLATCSDSTVLWTGAEKGREQEAICSRGHQVLISSGRLGEDDRPTP